MASMTAARPVLVGKRSQETCCRPALAQYASEALVWAVQRIDQAATPSSRCCPFVVSPAGLDGTSKEAFLPSFDEVRWHLRTTATIPRPGSG